MLVLSAFFEKEFNSMKSSIVCCFIFFVVKMNCLEQIF